MGRRSKTSILFVIVLLVFSLFSCDTEVYPSDLCNITLNSSASRSAMGSIDAEAYLSSMETYYRATPNTNLRKAYGRTEGYVPHTMGSSIVLSQGSWTIDVVMLPPETAALYPEGITDEEVSALPSGSCFRATSGAILVNTTTRAITLTPQAYSTGRVRFSAYVSLLSEEYPKHDYTITLYRFEDGSFKVYNLSSENLVSGDTDLKPEVKKYTFLKDNGEYLFQLEGSSEVGAAYPIVFEDPEEMVGKSFNGFEKEYDLPPGIYVARIKVRDYNSASSSDSKKQVLYKDSIGFKVVGGLVTTVYGYCDSFNGDERAFINWLPDPEDNSSKLYLGTDIVSFEGEKLKDETIYVFNGDSSSFSNPESATSVAFDLNGHNATRSTNAPLLNVGANAEVSIYSSSSSASTSLWGYNTDGVEDSSLLRTASVIALDGGTLRSTNCESGSDLLEFHGASKAFNATVNSKSYVKAGAINFSNGTSTSAGGIVELSGNVLVTGVKGITALSEAPLNGAVSSLNPASSLASTYDITIAMRDGAQISAEGDGDWNGKAGNNGTFNDLAAGIYLVGRTDDSGRISISLDGADTKILATGDSYTEKENLDESSSFGIFIRDTKSPIEINITGGATIETDGFPIYLKNCSGPITINLDGNLSTTDSYAMVFENCSSGENTISVTGGTITSSESAVLFLNSDGTFTATGSEKLSASALFKNYTFTTTRSLVLRGSLEYKAEGDTIVLEKCTGNGSMETGDVTSVGGNGISIRTPSNLTFTLSGKGTYTTGMNGFYVEYAAGTVDLTINDKTFVTGKTLKSANSVFLYSTGKNATVNLTMNRIDASSGSEGNSLRVEDKNTVPTSETITVNNSRLYGSWAAINFASMLSQNVTLNLNDNRAQWSSDNLKDANSVEARGSFPINFANSKNSNSNLTLNFSGIRIYSSAGDRFAVRIYSPKNVDISFDNVRTDTRTDTIYVANGTDKNATLNVSITGGSILSAFRGTTIPNQCGGSNAGYGVVSVYNSKFASATVSVKDSKLLSPEAIVAMKGSTIGTVDVRLDNANLTNLDASNNEAACVDGLRLASCTITNLKYYATTTTRFNSQNTHTLTNNTITSSDINLALTKMPQ